MVRKSYGKMRGTRQKLKRKSARRIADYMREYNLGDMVHIDFASMVGMPHPKFQGLTGEIIGKRGHAYMVRIRDMNKFKTILLKPQHLKPQMK